MASTAETMLSRIRELVAGSASREQRARDLAETVREFGRYRWVGVYDVADEFVSIIAWSGPGAPAYPTFPVTKGLTGSAIAQKGTVMVGDVRNDPRYLTAFGSTLSEIIIPVVRPRDERVIGTIDVESDGANAFSDEDRRMLEACAAAALRLWDPQTSAT